MKKEYIIKESITKEDLLKFGFVTYNHKMFTYCSYLYNKIIKVRFTVDLSEREMIWEVYDAANQKPYNVFYNNPNGDHHKVVIECIEQFNKIIKKMKRERIIEGEYK